MRVRSVGRATQPHGACLVHSFVFGLACGREFLSIIQFPYLGCSMQGIISNILQRMKSASHSTISAPVWDISHLGCSMAVRYLSSRHGCIKHVTPVISARVFQGERWLEDIAKCQRFPSSSCSPITYVFRRIRTSHFLAFSLHSSTISFFSAHLLSSIWIRCSHIHESGLALPPKEIYVGKITCSQALCAIFVAVSNS